ncbi:PadR family transcriptional regulator [Secundilactobacillus folii]|uniref:Transcription regulator PadR N-terminal domain-containing protein n=1 Tax=Secundilactobacillus folii TaxID=2678357 RepID=A0A7X2XUZ5_9LACO|nr:PadR family transcriptional regulator [Secundilactobacillus folii]MTV82129.1 hypothetical protein [Secundilactobacillus folii]
MYTVFVLGQLLDDAMSGYRLREILSNIVGQREKVSYGIIHPLLEKLAQSGDIILTKTTAQNNRPQKIATITDRGRATFDQLMRTPIKVGKHEELQYLLKLNNLHHVSKEEGRQLINQFIAFNESVLEEATANAQNIAHNELMNAGEKHSAIAIAHYKVAQAKTAISWAKGLEV